MKEWMVYLQPLGEVEVHIERPPDNAVPRVYGYSRLLPYQRPNSNGPLNS